MSPCQNCNPGSSTCFRTERNSLINLIEKGHKKDESKSVMNTGGGGLSLSTVLKSPFVICFKMAAVGNRKYLLVVVWFSSPCCNMLTAQGPADRDLNIWLLWIAERAHIYYTWRSVHLPESHPACSSISASKRTHDNTLFLCCLQAAKQHKCSFTFLNITQEFVQLNSLLVGSCYRSRQSLILSFPNGQTAKWKQMDCQWCYWQHLNLKFDELKPTSLTDWAPFLHMVTLHCVLTSCVMKIKTWLSSFIKLFTYFYCQSGTYREKLIEWMIMNLCN